MRRERPDSFRHLHRGRARAACHSRRPTRQPLSISADFRKASAPPLRTPLQREAAAQTKLESDEVAALPLIAAAIDAILSDCCGILQAYFTGDATVEAFAIEPAGASTCAAWSACPWASTRRTGRCAQPPYMTLMQRQRRSASTTILHKLSGRGGFSQPYVERFQSRNPQVACVANSVTRNLDFAANAARFEDQLD